MYLFIRLSCVLLICVVKQFWILYISGAFVSALEYSTDKRAEIVGKPSKEFFKQSIADFAGVNMEDCVMIGDVSCIQTLYHSFCDVMYVVLQISTFFVSLIQKKFYGSKGERALFVRQNVSTYESRMNTTTGFNAYNGGKTNAYLEGLNH